MEGGGGEVLGQSHFPDCLVLRKGWGGWGGRGITKDDSSLRTFAHTQVSHSLWAMEKKK